MSITDDMPEDLRHLYALAIKARLAVGNMRAAYPGHPQHIPMVADAAALVEPLCAALEEALGRLMVLREGAEAMGALTAAIAPAVLRDVARTAKRHPTYYATPGDRTNF